VVPDRAQPCQAEGFYRQQLKRLENCAQRGDGSLAMKSILVSIVAAVLVVGCGGPSASERALLNAAENGNIIAVKRLLAAGVNVNAKDILGETPLHRAAFEGHKEIVQLLIAKAADVNAKDKYGGTPLFYAATGGHKEIAELLITAGADVNAKILIGKFKGETPLDYAIFYNYSKTADLLRKHGGKTAKELKAEGK
jgi:ankyrin repeat protein